MANDILYSGTVTAAMEGIISGIPSLAVSLDSYEDEADFTYAARFTAGLARQMHKRGLPPGILLNINVPSLPPSDIAGVEITRLGQRLYKDALVKRKDPRGRSYYWIGGERPGGVTEEGTDIWALANGKVSITPIRLDMTDHPMIDELKNWEIKAQ